MHELSVTPSVLDIACRHASEDAAGRTVCIDLVIGNLSRIVDDSVQFCFDFVRTVWHRAPNWFFDASRLNEVVEPVGARGTRLKMIGSFPLVAGYR